MRQVVISTRIPEEMYGEVRKIAEESYLNESDFFRSAIRKQVFEQKVLKLKRDFLNHRDSVKAVKDLRKLESLFFSDKEIQLMSDKKETEMP